MAKFIGHKEDRSDDIDSKSEMDNSGLKDFFFISVVMPVCNEARYIRRSIESLLKQTYPQNKMEIIIVDGVSDDETRDVILEYCKVNKNIRLFSNAKRVIPLSLNRAIQEAKGEVIVRIDGHWYVHQDLLEEVNQLFRNREIDCLGGRILWETETSVGDAIELARKSFLGGGVSLRRNPKIREHFTRKPNIAHIWRREVFDKVGLFDARFIKNQDNDFNLRTFKLGLKTFYSPKILYHQYMPNNYIRLFKQVYGYSSYMPMLIFKHGSVLYPCIFAFSLLFLIWFIILGCAFMDLVSLNISLLLIGVYLYFILFEGLRTSVTSKKIGCWLGISFSYCVIHVGVGLGYLCGIVRLFNPSFIQIRRVGD